MVGRFVTLRNELLASILTEWLPLKFVALVDYAMCTNNDRERWLKMLKGWCILPSVSLEIENRVCLARWLNSRSIRVNTLKILSVEMTDAIVIPELTSWLPISACALRSVSFMNDCFAYIPYIYKHCTQLRTIEMRGGPTIAFWNIVRNNQQLTTLLLKGSLQLFVAVHPMMLPIAELTVPVDVDFLDYILPQLPDLRRLSMFGFYRKPIKLEPCNRLVSLNLRDATLTQGALVSMIGSLKVGLRRFAFPFVAEQQLGPVGYYRNSALHEVWPMHAETLECLEMYYRMDWCIAELINPCAVLHTLVIRSGTHKASKCAPKLAKILNPTIKTLHIDNCSEGTISAVTSNFTGMTTLGFINTERSCVIEHCTNSIIVCNSINTIYTNFCMPTELRIKKQGVVYKEYGTENIF